MIYQKKPVVIEANVYRGGAESATAIINWALVFNQTIFYSPDDNTLRINTLEGTMAASPGDFIIRGVDNEFYPRKPGIFERTYDEVCD